MSKKKKIIIIVVAVVVAVIISAIIGFTSFYIKSMEATGTSDETIIVSIPQGSTSSEIGTILKENNLIKNEFTFKLYTKLNDVSDMRAGQYQLNRTMSVSEIVECLQQGKNIVKDTVDVTFLEGKNMRWIAKKIANNTENSEDDVFNLLKDENYLDSLINEYWFITDEIKNENIYYSLEGYLFPDTYNIKIKASVQDIFKIMLDQMEQKLEPYKEEIESKGISVHKLLTTASIVEMEAANDEDRGSVASVIYNRLSNNMAIGSDVTTYYAIKVEPSERDLYKSELNSENAYNTRGPNMEGKLPVGPICSVGEASIKASLYPDETDYLYFVADKNGKLYFAKTSQEHNNNIAKLQSEGLWYSYEN